MKKFIALLIIFVLVIAFSGCNTEDNPKENIGELEEISNSVSEEQEESEIRETDDGVLDEAELYIIRTGEYITVKKGDIVGDWTVSEVWAKPAEAPGSRYKKDVGVTLTGEDVFEGYIVKNEAYEGAYDFILNEDGSNGSYKLPCLVMEGDILSKNLLRAMFAEDLSNKPTFDKDEILYCRVTVNAVDIGWSSLGAADVMHITKIDPLPTPTANFTFNPNGGEIRKLMLGDVMGEWTLTRLETEYLNETDEEVWEASGTFTGDVVLEGKIVCNPMAKEGYDLVISDKEEERIPQLITTEGTKDGTRFFLIIPEGLENYPDLDFDEEMKCRVTVSEYRFVHRHMSAMDRMVVTKIEVIE